MASKLGGNGIHRMAAYDNPKFNLLQFFKALEDRLDVSFLRAWCALTQIELRKGSCGAQSCLPQKKLTLAS